MGGLRCSATSSWKRTAGFDEHELSNLSRVNLLVGKNDCGKTSIPEAIHFLVSRGDPMVLVECAGRHEERTDVALRSAASPLAEVGSSIAANRSAHALEDGQAGVAAPLE